MATRILLRRGFAADWEAENPILSYGEVGVELKSSIDQTIASFRIGNGSTPWRDLAYFQDTGSLINDVVGPGISVSYNTLKKISDYVDGKILPTGGATGQVLVKASGTNFNVAWSQLSFSGLSDTNMAGLTDRDSLVYSSSASRWIRAARPRVFVQSTTPATADVREGDLWIF